MTDSVVLSESIDLRPEDDDGASQDVVWGMSSGDRWFVSLALLVTAMLSLGWMLWRGTWSIRPVEVSLKNGAPFVYQIEVNEARWTEWLQLPGIGEKLAKTIVEDRDRQGAFRSIDDVARVKGIGPKTLEKLRPHLRYEARMP